MDDAAREALAQVEALNLEGAAVLLVRMDLEQSAMDELVAQIGVTVRAMVARPPLIICVGLAGTIEAMGEDAMEAAGWIRAERLRGELDSAVHG